MRPLLAAALAAFLALSGCASLEAPDPAPAGPDPAATDPAGPPADAGGPAPPQAAANGEPVPAEAVPGAVVFRTEGNTTANAAMWGLDTALLLGIRAMDVHVPPETHAAVFEVAWDDAVQDLDLELHPSGDDWLRMADCGALCDRDGHVGAPDSPVRILLDRAAIEEHTVAGCTPERLEWGQCNVWVPGLRSKDANALLHYRVAVTLFSTDVPEGYTAL